MTVLRSLAFNAWFYGVTTALCLWHGLFTRQRAGVTAAARSWARLVLGGLRRLCRIDWVVTGREHLPAGAALIAPMHQSAFDTMVWLTLVPNCVYVLKYELTRVPVFGRLLLSAGMIPVDRGGGASALRDLVRRATTAAAAGQQILIFPEGTRAPPGAIGQLQPGVAALSARTGLPVIPVATNSGHRWGRRAFQKHPGTIHIAILPALPAGLPREALLAALQCAYTEGYAALRQDEYAAARREPVDNSVGQPDDELPPQSSRPL